MKPALAFAFTLTIAAALSGQSSTEQVKSPKEVLHQFIKLELEGVRLTPEGLHQSSVFFVRPSPPPRDKEICVVSDSYELHESHETHESGITANSAKLYLFFFRFYGWLDSGMRFKPSLKEAPGGGIIKEGITADYSLVLTDKHWELESDGRELKEVTGAPEWRIESAQVGTISLTTAIRYVTDMRDKVTNPVIKKNADKTIASLKRLQSSSQGAHP